MKKFNVVEKSIAFKDKAINGLNKSKSFLVAGSALALTSVANAAITVDEATGKVGGELDLAPFFSGAKVILVALASLIVIKWVMGLMRRA